MPEKRSLVSKPSTYLAIAISSAVAWGCDDAPGDPLALLMTQESQPSLQFSPAVPSLPVLAAMYDLEQEIEGSVALWTTSWTLDDDDAVASRYKAHERAAPILAEAMGHDRVEQALLGLARSIESAREHGESMPAELRGSLDVAQRLTARGLRALGDGDAEEAIRLGLEASDALQGVSPAVVARVLIHKARAELGRIPERRTYTDQTWHRARRLILGAEEAIEQGDLPRAIRRAYYACQVLGVELP